MPTAHGTRNEPRGPVPTSTFRAPERPDRRGRPPAPPAAPRAGLFERAAAWTIRFTGGRWGFSIALLVVLAWAITGPIFHYSEMWQLVINTGTSVMTFLMVFLIQNAQNRESKAVHLKLDELIRAVTRANDELIHVEGLSEVELDALAERYRELAERHRKKVRAKVEEIVERKVEEKYGPPRGKAANGRAGVT